MIIFSNSETPEETFNNSETPEENPGSSERPETNSNDIPKESHPALKAWRNVCKNIKEQPKKMVTRTRQKLRPATVGNCVNVYV